MHSLLRRMRQAACHNLQSDIAESLANQDIKGKRKAVDGQKNELRGGVLQSFPEIDDNGSPTPNRYSDAEMYWNSVMVEAVSNTEKPNRERAHSNSCDACTTDIDDQKPSRLARPRHLLNRMTSDSVATIGMRKSRPSDSQIDYGMDCTENDYFGMQHDQPQHMRRASMPMLESPRPDVALVVGTAEYDNFMDFPRPTVEWIPSIPATTQDATPSTWNGYLETVLEHPDADSEMSRTVRERIEGSEMPNGSSGGVLPGICILEAGLVPNFSRPVATGGFFDRVAAEKMPPQSINVEPPQTNGHAVHCNRLDGLVFVEPHINGTVQVPVSVPQIAATELTNSRGSSSSQYGHSSSTTTLDSLYRAPTPPGGMSNGFPSILSEALTRPELSTLRKTLANRTHRTRTQEHSSTSTDKSLIRKLYDTIKGLQDRNKDLEEKVIPQLSETLEQKSEVIDILIAKIENLETTAKNQGTTLDFGSEVLQGCWAREYEIWRTLAFLRQKREKRKIVRLRRAFSRQSNELRHRVAFSAGKPYMTSTDTDIPQHITNRELDALILMAEQNLHILRDDVDDMVDMVDVCKDQTAVCGALEILESSG